MKKYIKQVISILLTATILMPGLATQALQSYDEMTLAPGAAEYAFEGLMDMQMEDLEDSTAKTEIENNTEKTQTVQYVLPESLARTSEIISDTTDFACVADTYVQKGKTDTHGTESTAIITTGNTRECYYSFDLGDGSFNATRAIFRFYLVGTSRPVVSMKVGSAGATQWDEKTLVWGQKPSYTHIGDFNTVEGGNAWIEVDVTQAVANVLAEGGKRITFVLYDSITDQTGLSYSFSTKEGNSKPVLKIDMDYTPIATTGTVESANYILIPDQGERRIPLSILAYDQYGRSMSCEVDRWTILNNTDGLSIDGNELVVNSSVQPRRITVSAEFGNTQAQRDILVSVSKLNSIRFPVLSDASVLSGSTNVDRNYGGDKLMIRADGQKRFYIKFNFERMEGAIKSARLRLYKDSTAAGSIKMSIATHNDWIEGDKKGVTAENGELCFNNAPSYGEALATYQIGGAKGYVELDITNAIQKLAMAPSNGDKVTTLVFYGDVDGLKTDFTFMPRESDTPPELSVDYYYQPKVNRLFIEGPKQIVAPDITEPQTQVMFKVLARDHYGKIVSAPVHWSISRGDGVTVDDSGLVTVTQTVSSDFDIKVLSEEVETETTVKCIDNAEALTLAASMFDFDKISFVTDNLNMPSVLTIPNVGGGEVSILWTSDREDIIRPDGTVTRPPSDFPSPKMSVNLKAVFLKGNAQLEKSYNIEVLKQGRRITIKPEIAGFYYRTQFTPWDYQMKSGMRYCLYRFDLSSYAEQLDIDYIYGARLRLGGDAKDYIETHYVPNDEWAQNWNTRLVNGVIPDLVVPEVKDYLGNGYYIIENDTKTVGVDVVNVLKRDLLANDYNLTLRTGSARNDLAGNLTVKNPVLELEAVYDPTPTSLVIEQDIFYDEKIRIPSKGIEERTYVAKTLDQFGMEMDDSFTFTLAEEYQGVHISPEGVLTVDGTASIGQIVLRAVSAAKPSLSTFYPIDIIEKVEVIRPRLYLTEDEIFAFRQRIVNNPQLLERIKTESSIAESVSGKIDDLFNMNGWRASIDTPVRTFIAPENAAYAEFGVTARGIGKVMLDNFEVQNLGKENVPVQNVGFETGVGTSPMGWRSVVMKGEPILKWENNNNDQTVAYSGKRSISYEGFKEDDSGAWFADRLPVQPGDEFYFGVYYSQKHYMSKGFTFTINYYDSNGNVLGTEETETINWVTKVRRNGYFAPIVSNSIMYLLEENEKYLLRVKDMLMYCTWEMIYQIQRGDLSTGAVHVGRFMPAVAFGYELLDYAGLLTKEEDKLLRSNMYWLMEKLMDVSYFDYNSAQNHIHNYNADRSSGIGCLALALPEYSRSEEILQHAVSQWHDMIQDAIGNDGAWHETIRYHNAVFKVFFPFTVMLKNVKGIDLFENEKVKNYGAFMARVQGPRDKVNLTNPNSAILPNIGDSGWFEGNEAFGRTAYMVKDTDAKLSREIMHAWQRMNSVYPESNPTIYTHMNPNLPTQRPNYVSTAFQDIGYVVFRQNYDMPNEDYMHIIAKDTGYGSHQHQGDRGSFQIWKNGVPLVMEAGVGSYDKSGQIFETADYHNVLQFVANGSRDGGAIQDQFIKFDAEKDFFASNDLDTMRTTLFRGEGNGNYNRQIRNIAFVKNNFGVYILWDDLGYDQLGDKARFTYHALTIGSTQSGNTITSPGYQGMTLDTTFMQEEIIRPEYEWQLMAGGYPQINGQNQFQSISVEGPSNRDFLVALYPRKTNEEPLSITKIETNNVNLVAYRITKKDMGSFIVMKNSATVTQTAHISEIENMHDMRTGGIFQSLNGKVGITVGPKEIIYLRPESIAIPKATSVTLEGASTVIVPSAGEAQYVLQATTYDQYGNTMERENEDAVWSVSGNIIGVRVDNDGILYVNKDAPSNGIVTVTCTSGEVSANKTIQLIKDSSIGGVSIYGPTMVPVSSSGLSTIQYTAEFTDKYGVARSGVSAAWYLGKPIKGVSIGNKSGALSVSSAVPKGTKIELMVECLEKPNITNTLQVVVGDKGLSKLEITAPSIVGIPSEWVCSAKAFDQFGTEMPEEDVVFSLKDSVHGVSISPSGRLVVDELASEGAEVIVIATAVGNSSIQTTGKIQLRKNAPVKIMVNGNSRVEAPSIGYSALTYTVNILNQQGQVTDTPITWNLIGALTGVDINKNTGIMTVSSVAPTQTITVIATVKDNTAISDSMEVTIIGRSTDPSQVGNPSGGSGGGGGVTPISPQPVPTGNGSLPEQDTEYTDIDGVAWAKEAILSLTNEGIINGVGNGKFAPNEFITREQFAAMLVRTFGFEESVKAPPFTDAPADAWYSPYLNAAYISGVISGISENEFGVGQFITREQMASMAYRAVVAAGLNLNTGEMPQAFEDERDIEPYAMDAVNTMQLAGVIKGISDERFAPKEFSTRAQAAVVLHRLRLREKER